MARSRPAPVSDWRTVARRALAGGVFAAAMALSIPTSTAADTTAPTVTSFGRTGPSSTYNPGDTVTFNYTATDDTGISYVDVWLLDPGGTERMAWSAQSAGTVAFTLDRAWPTGTYTVNFLLVGDNAEHATKYYRNGTIERFGADTSGPTTHSLNLPAADFTVAPPPGAAAPTIDSISNPKQLAGQPVTITGTAVAGGTAQLWTRDATKAYSAVASTTVSGAGLYSFVRNLAYNTSLYVRSPQGQSATKTVTVKVKVTIDSVRYAYTDPRGKCVVRFNGGTYPYIPGARVYIRTTSGTPVGSTTVTRFGGSGRYSALFGLNCASTYTLFSLISGTASNAVVYTLNGTGSPVKVATPIPATYIRGVTPGAFCSQHGAYGVTSTGQLMQCKTSATDTRYRWRAV